MDYAAILALIVKGMDVVSTAIAIGKEAKPAIDAVVSLVESAQGGTVTPEQLASTEATLDGMINDFNAPLPPE